MKEQEFGLEDFRNHLQELEKELTEGTKQDPGYQGEVDEVLASLRRLATELQDERYRQVLPDLFRVLDFLDMVVKEPEERENDS